MKKGARFVSVACMIMGAGLLFSGCYTQLGTMRDDNGSAYDQPTNDEYSSSDTTQQYTDDRNLTTTYDDNFYGANSFSRYRFFSYYYPTYYWNWQYDPWYDYSWNNPWYDPWMNPWASPYYGGYYGGGYYSPYYPWYPGSVVVYGNQNGSGARRQFGQGRGVVTTQSPGRSGRYGTSLYQTPPVDLPSAVGRAGSSGASVRSNTPQAKPAAQPARTPAVSRPSGSSTNGRSPGATRPSGNSGNSGRSRGSEGQRVSSPPPPPPSSAPSGGGGERSGGGGGGRSSGGGGGRTSGGGRGR